MADQFDDLRTFMAAIRRLESGSFSGNYGALGPVTSTGDRARGAYQIMASNWDWWAKEAGVPGADWRDEKAQDWVAEFKFTQYFNRYRSWDLVAIAWFGGPGRANQAEEDFGSVANLTDMLGTSIGQYVETIRKHMKNAPAGYNIKKDLLAHELTSPSSLGPPSDYTMAGVYSSPTFMYDEWLRRYGGVDPNAAPEPEAPPVRNALTRILGTLADTIAGGRRTTLQEASARIKELALDAIDTAQEGVDADIEQTA